MRPLTLRAGIYTSSLLLGFLFLACGNDSNDPPPTSPTSDAAAGTGGQANVGGSGGVNTGGKSSTGGSSTGGGSPGNGGSAGSSNGGSGGTNVTGGAAGSGAANQGGSSTGGAPNVGGSGGTPGTGIVANHLSVAPFSNIPETWVQTVKQQLRIFYGHTSHGRQPVKGMQMLETTDGPQWGYESSWLEQVAADLGSHGALGWEQTTRERLNQPNNDRNLVIWSWCGGQSVNDAADVQVYLNAMSKLEQDYPTIKFVYMTGHTDSGHVATLRANNQIVRDYCLANNKILYDFEDIESWDPDGNYYADTGDDCPWCTTWCQNHSCPSCTDCPHSHCFNCYIKGKAFWWMLARIAGWPG